MDRKEKTTVIYWLTQIFNALGTLGTKIDNQVVSKLQSDWSESDNTDGAYIKNKPALKTVATSGSYNDLTNKPTIPQVLVVSGTVANNAFTPASGQSTLAAAVAVIDGGGIVYLKYTDTDKDIVEMAIACDTDTPSITTKNLTWS